MRCLDASLCSSLSVILVPNRFKKYSARESFVIMPLILFCCQTCDGKLLEPRNSVVYFESLRVPGLGF